MRSASRVARRNGLQCSTNGCLQVLEVDESIRLASQFVGAVASATPADPILAAIEVHRVAHTNEFSEIITSREQEVRLGAISDAAYKSFKDTDPTTGKGHAEKLAYVLEREKTFMSDDGITYEAFASVLRGLQKFAA